GVQTCALPISCARVYTFAHADTEPTHDHDHDDPAGAGNQGATGPPGRRDATQQVLSRRRGDPPVRRTERVAGGRYPRGLGGGGRRRLRHRRRGRSRHLEMGRECALDGFARRWSISTRRLRSSPTKTPPLRAWSCNASCWLWPSCASIPGSAVRVACPALVNWSCRARATL